jgi:hypothetical protein
MVAASSTAPHPGQVDRGGGVSGEEVPDGGADLLPGLLAATRTGLPPAGDDELTNSKIHHDLRHGVTSALLGARKDKG